MSFTFADLLSTTGILKCAPCAECVCASTTVVQSAQTLVNATQIAEHLAAHLRDDGSPASWTDHGEGVELCSVAHDRKE